MCHQALLMPTWPFLPPTLTALREAVIWLVSTVFLIIKSAVFECYTGKKFQLICIFKYYTVYLKRSSCALNRKHGQKDLQSPLFQKHSWLCSCPGFLTGGSPMLPPLPLSTTFLIAVINEAHQPTYFTCCHLIMVLFSLWSNGPWSPKGQVIHFLKSEHNTKMHVEKQPILFGSNANIPLYSEVSELSKWKVDQCHSFSIINLLVVLWMNWKEISLRLGKQLRM